MKILHYQVVLTTGTMDTLMKTTETDNHKAALTKAVDFTIKNMKKGD